MKLQLFNYTGSVFLCDFPSQAGLSSEGRRIWKVINAYCGLTSREKFLWGVTQCLGATGIYGSDESPCIAGCIRLSPAGHISTGKWINFNIFPFFIFSIESLFYFTVLNVESPPPPKKGSKRNELSWHKDRRLCCGSRMTCFGRTSSEPAALAGHGASTSQKLHG